VQDLCGKDRLNQPDWHLLRIAVGWAYDQKVPFEIPLPPVVKAKPRNDASAVGKMDGIPLFFTGWDLMRSLQNAVISFAKRWFLVSFICTLP
jgi:hypothetical protein